MYDKINLMIATRKRINNGRLSKCILSFLNCVSDIKNICFTFLIDKDDIESIEFFLNAKDMILCDYHILINKSNEVNLAKFFNQMYNETKFNNPNILVTMMGDDMVMKTKNYDNIILKAINDNNGDKMVYVDDDYCQHEKLSVNMFITRKLVELTGCEFMCSIFPVDIIDRIWFDVCKATNRLLYLPNVILKHEHSWRPEIGLDETTNRLRKHYHFNKMDKILYNEEVQKRVKNLNA